MTESKSKAKVGDLVDVAEMGTVVRPEGYTSQVTGGSYVIDVAGVYVIDGSEVTAK